MTEEAQAQEAEDPENGSRAGGAGGARGAAGDAGSRKSARERVGDGIREGMGVLSAFKDALEETISEARERGDLSADKAREVVREALDKAQAASEKARDRLDFATHGELDALRERIARLEERVFGAAAEPEEAADGSGSDDGEVLEPDAS